jgi:subtilisin-like proprotein convertase family protein
VQQQLPHARAASTRFSLRTQLLAAGAMCLLLVSPLLAQTFNGTGTGAIPDTTSNGTFGPPRDVSFNVSGVAGSITDISLSMTMTHTWIGDLDVVLAPPGVTPGNAGSFIIYNRVGATTAGSGGDSSDLGGTYVFANSASTNIWLTADGLPDAGVIPAGSYRTVAAAPSSIPAAVTDFTAAFSALTPAQINGTWTLRFQDRGVGDVGTVSAAALTLTTGGGGGNNTLTVTRTGTGSGTVTSTPAGINCGGTCSASFPSATSVSLSAAAVGGSSFVSWGGDCSGSGACVLSMSQARNVSASFNSSGGGGGLGGSWINLGAAPAFNGQVEGITNRPVVGAVSAVAPHPTNPAILYVAAVNGGLWRSTNANAASPEWTRLFDTGPSLSMASLRFDPTDASAQTLLAGTGLISSLSSTGGARTGVFRTVDGGSNWTVLNGGGTLNNISIRAVAPRGNVLMAATSQGLYRSTDTGASFALVSGAGGSGLPSGNTTDVVGDPGNNSLLYTVVFGSASPGIYRSTDTGATWTRVSDTATDALINAGSRGLLAVGQSNNVFLAVVGTNGRLSAVIRSANGTSGWSDLGVPTTAEEAGALIGAHPGGQGGIHLSIAADPTNSNIVYIGGDRQPYFSEAAPGSGAFFPNSLGALDYSGRLFRGDAAQAPASRWVALTHSGTSNNSSPHADSRAMAFDAAGELIESDDGGVYKRISPRSTTGSWVSLNGDLEVTEYHGIAYDGLSDRVIGGAQDTGTTEQQQVGSRVFNSIHTGDGGDTAVDDISSASVSSRYSSFQNLSSFRRRTYNTANVFQGQTFPARTPINGSPALSPQFYTPITVNRVNGLRLLFGANNGVYESLDQGSTVDRISTVRVNGFAGDPLEYGVAGNAELVYLASGAGVYLRTTAGGALNLVNTIGTATIVDVAVDPAQPARLFALQGSVVSFSDNSGATFANVTGNLGTFSPGAFRSLAYVPRASGDVLVMGADRGAYYASASSGFSNWQVLGTGLPHAPVFELTYHAQRDALIAGMLGRGAWRLDGVANGGSGGDAVFANGFE